MLPKCGFIFCAVLFYICSEVNSGLTVIDVSQQRVDPPGPDVGWWKNGVFYQVYPRSFKEEEGGTNGIGNLKGIIEKLGHFTSTGTTAIWISNILMSAGEDHSHAISDFRDIHTDYGVMADFEELIREAHKINIKVILDIIINHSSKEHQWFKDSVAHTDDRKDFYVWVNGTGKEQKDLPNNWLSVYGDSAWEWSTERKQFYLHQFGIDEPDLNYHNVEVKKAMKEELKFWLDKGVDGFRLHAVPFLCESKTLQSEPRSNLEGVEQHEHAYLRHDSTMDQDETYDLIYELRAFIDEYSNTSTSKKEIILMSEAYTSIENTMRYYGNDKDKKGVHIPFNFQLIPLNKDSGAVKIVESINEWLDKMPDGQTANWLIGNHDNHRAATRFGSDLADNMNILIGSLPGVMITYNGEEIGQENGEVSFLQCKDPIGCWAGAEKFPNVSRDFERTPYHWDATDNAGFTASGVEPWLPVSKTHTTNNLKEQMSKGGHFNIYKDFMLLRKDLITKKGTRKIEAINDVIKITFEGEESKDGYYVLLINMGNKDMPLKISDNEKSLYKVIFSTDDCIIKKDNCIKENNKIWEKDLIVPANKTIGLQLISKPVTYDWWKNAVIYQIYVRSFKDGGADGIGDLAGLMSELPYLRDLGVNAVCLSSIYESPQRDLGYDVLDFEKVDQIYGGDSEFNVFTAVAATYGIKVILDFVPNHSSIEHKWFDDSKKRDYYVRHKVETGKTLNNWLSIYKGKAWTELVPKSNEYYLHQFDSSQADLDYSNNKVQEVMQGILKTWLGRGVAGFRMTSIPYLFEDKNFPDEPISNDATAKKNQWKSLRHVYTSDLPATFDIIYKWRELIDIYTAENGGYERILITEANTDIYNTMYYYGRTNKTGAHFTSNFQLIETVDGTSNAVDFAKRINEWVDLIPDDFISNWMLGNHDKRRVASRFGPENVDGFNMLVAILPGVMVTYNGEEIGQEDGEVPADNCNGDPVFCPKDGQTEKELEELRELRRDRQRTPFHWNGDAQAGFTKGNKTWLPVSNAYTKTNVAIQTGEKGSHYELYKRLVQLRKQAAFVKGTLKVRSVTDYVLTSLRYLTTNESYFHIFNLGDKEETFSLKSAYPETTSFLEIVETSDPTKLPTGTLLSTDSMTLQGHQSVIAAFTPKTGPSSATIQVVSSFVLLICLLINLLNFN